MPVYAEHFRCTKWIEGGKLDLGNFRIEIYHTAGYFHTTKIMLIYNFRIEISRFTLALDAVIWVFSHNAIGPPHLNTAFVSFWHFENNVFNNTRDMSIA